MFSRPEITPVQLFTLMAVGVICGSWLVTPISSIAAGGQMAWFVSLIALLLGLFLIALIVYLVTPDRGEKPLEFIDVVEALLGRRLGIAFLLFLATFMILCVACDLVLNGVVVYNAFFHLTPLWAIFLLELVLFGYLAWNGPIRIARAAPFFLAIVSLNMILIIILAWRIKDIGYLLPLGQWEEIYFGSQAFLVSMQTFRFVWAVAVFLYWAQTIKGAFKYLALGGLVGWTQLLILTNLPILVYGPKAARAFIDPVQPLLGTLVLPFFPIERWDAVALIIFQLNTFLSMAAMGFSAAYILDRIFKTQKIGYWLVGISLLVFSMGLAIPVTYHEYLMYQVGSVAMIFIPLFVMLAIVKFWKVKRGRWPLA